MTENYLDKKEIRSCKSVHNLILGITKKIWQTPKLQDIGLSETKSDFLFGDDGPGGDREFS